MVRVEEYTLATNGTDGHGNLISADPLVGHANTVCWRCPPGRGIKFGRIEPRGNMKKYAIVVEQAKHNYAAYVPDLPGCVATGATVQETEELLREAIEVHIAGLREDGSFVPPPSSVVDYLEVSA